MDSNKIVCFGEILWDLFPSGKKIGGAPFNVASSLKGLGASVEFISRIGQDALGEEILNHLTRVGISKEYVQLDGQHATGRVLVTLDEKGSAQYEIETNAAWDFIESTPSTLNLVKQSHAFVFGSLITRAQSFKALRAFLKVARFSVFDLNLRPPYYSDSVLIELMNTASMLKFNDEELYQIADLLKSPYYSMDQHISYIAQKTNTELICVTKGKFGAVLYYKNVWYFNSGYQIKVQDTVGAGDSFLATLIHGIVNDNDLQKTLNRACAMGALVAGSAGANPSISEVDLIEFMKI